MDIQAKFLLKTELRAMPCQTNCSCTKNELLYYTKQQTTFYNSKNTRKKLVRGKKCCVGHVFIGPKLKNFAFTIKEQYALLHLNAHLLH